MNEHLTVSSCAVAAGAVAVLVLEGACRHGSTRLNVPDNIVLLPLPPYAPELNPAENIWEYLRGNELSRCVWDGYEAIVDACCNAWHGLMDLPHLLRSITDREYARVRI